MNLYDITTETAHIILFVMLIFIGIYCFFAIRKIQKRRKIGFEIYEQRQRIINERKKLLKYYLN